jgi:uncharacterized protein
MNSMFFGSSDKPLYGVYHPPKARAGRATGVVLCAPFGQEYMRGHRAFRQLSLMLAKAGFHVFRFDYRGSGDSWGDGDRFSFAGAVDDAVQAAEELSDMADLAQVAFVGVRLGGSIAAEAAARVHDSSHLVLWDPILNGDAYLRELRQADVVHAAAHADSAPQHGGRAELADDALTVMGFPVPRKLQEELQAYRFPEQAPGRSVRMLLVADPALTPGGRQLSERCGGDFVSSPLPGRWDEVDNWGSAMIPQAAIQEIANWLIAEVSSV